jgi:hypothetical protein
MNDQIEPRPAPPDDCRDEVAAQRQADERIVLRVRDKYSQRWAGYRALDEAARAIREQA